MHKLLKKITKRDNDGILRGLAIVLFLGIGIWLYPQLGARHFLIALLFAGTAMGLLCWSSMRLQRTLHRELASITQGIAPLASDAASQDIATLTPQALAEYIQEQLQHLNDKHQHLNAAANMLAAQTQDAQRATQEVSRQLEQQQGKTQTVTAYLEALRVAFDTTKASAAEALAVSQKSETEGDSGKLVMTEAMSGVMALGESVNETGDMVETLGKDSEAIGGIVNVIKSVAEQTNLLALNAAIEAARAGEQGRGFAVVADEVRSLANKTQESAQEIENLIQQLLRNVESASASIHGSMQLAEKSDELIEGMVMSYSEIVGHMKEIDTLAKGMMESAQQGQQTTGDASKSLEQLEAMVETSLGHLSQFEHSSHELAALSAQLQANS